MLRAFMSFIRVPSELSAAGTMRPKSSTAGYKTAVRRAICSQYNVVTFCSPSTAQPSWDCQASSSRFYLDPSAIERHVGSAILQHALKIARTEHAGPVRLEETLNAIGFYEHFGFRPLERSSLQEARSLYQSF